MAGLDPERYALVNVGDLVDSFPPIFANLIPSDALKDIWLVPPTVVRGNDLIRYDTGLVFDRPIALGIPGLDALQIVIGAHDDATIFEFEVQVVPQAKITVKEVPIALRLRSDLFKPARLNAETNAYEVDPDRAFLDIQLGIVTLSVDGDAGVQLSASSSIDLPPTLIAESGVVIQASDIQLFLTADGQPPNRPIGTKGIAIASASLFLPGTLGRSLTLAMTNAFIGNGGFSGTLEPKDISPPIDEDFGGITVGLSSVKIQFVQNALVDATLVGTALIPYFEKRIQVALTLGIGGHIALAVTGVPAGQGSFNSTTGILSLSAGPLNFDLTRVAVELLNGKGIFHASGKVTPAISGVTFPSFELRDLAVDSDGHLSLSGGWIDLPKQAVLDLHGFSMELTKIGFGVDDDDYKWIGLSGGVKIVDGLQAGASVKGLRIRWKGSDISLSLEGVGIKLEVPNVLLIEGEVALNDRQFAGAVKLALPKLNFAFDGQFVAGTIEGSSEKYFAVYVHTELPAGLPLGNTGLALFGAAGLYAHNMSPGRAKNEGWYLNPDLTDGWYAKKPKGVENLSKWKPDPSGMAFGAGVTLGTFADNGFEFNGRLLLVVSFPGPRIFIEGKANLFKQRAALAGDGEPMFRALAVIDPEESMLLALDAHFKYRANDGKLLDMSGSAEAFFNFKDAQAWHIWLGLKEDKKRRLRATAFKLFNVDAYYQLNARQLDLGSSWSFNKSYGFGRLGIEVKAWMEETASVSWHPAHFSGSINMGGSAKVKAFGRKAGVEVHPTLSGEVFSPYAIDGKFWAGISLPWPLPNLGVTIKLKWTERMDGPAPLPLPLQEASAEIPRRALRWAFKRGTNLLPNNDQGEGEFTSPPKVGTGAELPSSFTFSNALHIPVDAQLGLTFSRPVEDASNVGVTQTSKVIPDVVGDPVTQDVTKTKGKVETGYTVAYSLSSVVLEKLSPTAPSEAPGKPLPAGATGVGWILVSKKDRNPSKDVPELIGAWTRAYPPQMPEDQEKTSETKHAQTKLMLNAKSPFEYTGLTSRTWEEWFTKENPNYPGDSSKPTGKTLATFMDHDSHELLETPFEFDDPAFEIQWMYGGDVAPFTPPISGIDETIDRGLRIAPLPSPDGLSNEGPDLVVPPSGVSEVTMRVRTPDEFSIDTPVGWFGPNVDPQEVLKRTLQISGDAELKTRYNGVVFGLVIEGSIRLHPKEPARAIEMTFYSTVAESSTVANVQLFNTKSEPILPGASPVTGGTSTVRLDALDINTIVITLQSEDLVLLTHIEVRTPVLALAESTDGLLGPFVEQDDGLIKVVGPNLGNIYLGNTCGGEFLILELSLKWRKQDITKHTVDSLQYFKGSGPLFEPETDYRLTIKTQRDSTTGKRDATGPVNAQTGITEQLYFRTAPLPGIGVPAVPGDPNNTSATGFEDLGFYLKRTIPAVPAPAGGHNTPARAFYRAYDQAVEFSAENPYVQLMYRLGRRDLTLRLFDANNQPLRDQRGRLLLPGCRWEQSPDKTISESAKRWIEMVNAAYPDMPPFSTDDVMRSEVLSAPSEETVLPAEVLHQARVVPMLLHEAFSKARASLVANGAGSLLDRWHAEQTDTNPSKWHVLSETTSPIKDPITVYFVREDNKLVSSLVYDGPLAGDQNHPDHPKQWTDLRASVQFRWQGGEVGFDVRRASANDLIRVTLNRDTGARRLLAVVGGQSSVLAEDTTAFPTAESDVIITLECVGNRVQVFQDLVDEHAAEPIFDVAGALTTAGTVALYSNAATGPRFTEIMAHDLRPNPSTAYRFDFITSKYTNFDHHLHSFDDQLFGVADDAGITDSDMDTHGASGIDLPAASSPSGLDAVGEPEARAFEALEDLALHFTKLRIPERVEILRANKTSAKLVLMLRSPEPLLWERTQLLVSTSSTAPVLGIPGDLKLTAVSLGSMPIDESVSIEVRNRSGLEGCRLEWRPIPATTTSESAWSTYYEFEGEEPLGDGVTVQVFSGVLADAPERRPGTAQRFVAEDASTAQVHFPSTGLELRLVGSAGAVIHQRQFLPASAYSAVDVRAVRKADGSALFLFAAPGTTLPTTGSLRLSFKLTRDLSGSFPATPVLRQAGDVSPELAVLDLLLE